MKQGIVAVKGESFRAPALSRVKQTPLPRRTRRYTKEACCLLPSCPFVSFVVHEFGIAPVLVERLPISVVRIILGALLRAPDTTDDWGTTVSLPDCGSDRRRGHGRCLSRPR